MEELGRDPRPKTLPASSLLPCIFLLKVRLKIDEAKLSLTCGEDTSSSTDVFFAIQAIFQY